MKQPGKAVRITLPAELYAQLQAEASETYRTVPGYIRYILRQYISLSRDSGNSPK